ncbi:MAG: acetyltransferase, partial [Frankiales bacterium]|nr:acetyltransferase [Frankiales bacterium]
MQRQLGCCTRVNIDDIQTKVVSGRPGAHKTRRYARGVTAKALLFRIETHNLAVGLPGARIEFRGPVAIVVAPDDEHPVPARFVGKPTVEDITEARAHLAAAGVPERFEWIAELHPTAAAACTGAGLVVRRHPLLILDELTPPAPAAGVTVECLTSDTTDALASTAAAVSAIAFAHGPAGERPADSTEVQLATALFSRGRELARTRAALADARSTAWLARFEGHPAAAG